MHLEVIQCSGTARSFLHKLSPLTVITGPNMAGKSTVENVIQALLLGSVPELGKTNGATMQIAANGELKVAGRFSDGSAASRTWTPTKTGASLESSVPDFLSKPMAMLDPAAYFGMTEGEQVKYIFANMTVPASCTVDGILSEFHIGELPGGEVFQAIAKELKLSGVSEGLVKLTGKKGYITERYAALNQRVKDTIGAVRTMTELKNRSNECSAETLSFLNQRIADAKASHDVANQAGGQLQAQERQAKATQQRREHLQSVLAIPALDESEKQAELEALEKALRSEWDQSQDEVDLAKLRAESTAAVVAWESARQKFSAANEDAIRIEREIKALDEHTECPFCKSHGKDWKKHLAETLKAQYNSACSGMNALDLEVASTSKKKSELNAKGHIVKDAQEDSQRFRDRLREVTEEMARIEERKTRDAERREQRQAELATLTLVSEPTPEETSAVINAIELSQDELQKLSDKRDAALRLQRDMVNAEEAHEEHVKAKEQFETVKAYKSALEEKQKTLIEDLFQGLLEDANYFTDGIMKAPLSFYDGKIGYWNGNFVSHATFSDTEKHLAYMAVTCALAKDAPLRIALLDKLDVDTDNFPRIMQRLAEAVETGRLDQVVMAVTSAPEVEGWEVIALEKEVA